MNLKLSDEDASRAAAVERHLMRRPEWRPAVLAVPESRRGEVIARIIWEEGLFAVEARMLRDSVEGNS
jgi:hypothetical protein